MHVLCDCGQYIIGMSGHMYSYFVMATRGELRQWGISHLFRISTSRKIAFGNFCHPQESYGNSVACVLCTLGCFMRLIWGCENLTNDGRRRGGHEKKFSHEWVVMKIESRMDVVM